MKNRRTQTSDSSALQEAMVRELLLAVHDFRARAAAAGNKITLTRLLEVATGDVTLLGRARRGHGVTLRSYCNVLSFCWTRDPAQPLPAPEQCNEPPPFTEAAE